MLSIIQRIYQHDHTTDPPNPQVHNVPIVGFGALEGRPTRLCRIHGEKVGGIEDMRMCIVNPYLDAQFLSSLRSLFLIKDIIRDKKRRLG